MSIEIDLNLPAPRVVRVLDRIAANRGYLAMLRMDNGPEFISLALAEWAEKHAVKVEFIWPGSQKMHGTKTGLFTQKFRITNWHTYNNALINRGSMTFWLDDEAIKSWYDTSPPSARGRPQRYSDLAITTVLVIKRVFRLPLRAAQGFIDSIFTLMGVPLRCLNYTCVSRRAKSVNVSFKTVTRGEITHLVIDSTGLKLFGEGEWKVKKHGKERRRIWRKLHLAVDSKTHEIICADLSLNNVTDLEGFPGLIRQTHRKIRSVAADGAYDTRLCHDELRRKKIRTLIPPRKGAGYWPGEYEDRNRGVANQRLSGSNARWKWTTEYNRRSIAETAMYRVKQLFGGSLTLRDYDGQVAEALAMVRALNKMTKAGMPENVRIA
ncbi:IS5 family transposase [Salmonella enterica]|nr:IS5 family transposase [Salmonella enterica]